MTLQYLKNRIPNISPTVFEGNNLKRVRMHLDLGDCSVLLLGKCDLDV